MEPLAALQMSAAALGVAAALFQVRLMYVAGPDFEDFQAAIESQRAKGRYRAVPLLAALLLLCLMTIFQLASWIIASWIYPVWNQALHLVPIAVWLGFVLGLRVLVLYHRFLKSFRFIEKRYLAALVVINFVSGAAITYFYAIGG